MNVTAEPVTPANLWQRATAFTSGGKLPTRTGWGQMLLAEHSPIRCQLYWVEMVEIPSFVSVHFVRHKMGVEHFVQSLRDDRGGDGTETRETPVNHAMLANAQALIFMARKRLCEKAHVKTSQVMVKIKAAVRLHDPVLADHMVAECAYRNGFCPEASSCGMFQKMSVY